MAHAYDPTTGELRQSVDTRQYLDEDGTPVPGMEAWLVESRPHRLDIGLSELIEKNLDQGYIKVEKGRCVEMDSAEKVAKLKSLGVPDEAATAAVEAMEAQAAE